MIRPSDSTSTERAQATCNSWRKKLTLQGTLKEVLSITMMSSRSAVVIGRNRKPAPQAEEPQARSTACGSSVKFDLGLVSWSIVVLRVTITLSRPGLQGLYFQSDAQTRR